MVMIHIAAMVLGSHLVLAAEGVPTFDTAPSCRSAAAASVMTGRTTENCINDEKNAHNLLEQSWNQYSAADKAHCDSLERAGGPPSYVELLSCLEMSRDARTTAKEEQTKSGQDPANETAAPTTGAGTPGAWAPNRQPARPGYEPP
jgi:hypothetical protein